MNDKLKHPSAPNLDLTQAGLNLIQQALSIYDRDLKLAVCNTRFREMFDFPPHLTIPGASFAETLRFLAERGEYGDIPDIDVFIREKVKQARAFEPHYMERTRPSGTTISVEGNPLSRGGWVTVYTDITPIKRQEELLRSRSAHLSDQLLTHSEELARTNRELAATIAALEETKRQLTESEALTRSTTEMMPAHIAHLDLNECYTYSNRKLSSIIPGSPVEIIGRYARDALGTEIYDIIKPHLDDAFGGKPSVFEFSHSEGTQRIRAAFTPERSALGTITGVYILSMDVTEEAQARAALMQTHKRELAAQLTSGLAHDFANLLTIILGLQGRIEKLPGLPAEANELTATTRAAVTRGGVLLDRLSDISGHRAIRPVSTDMQGLLREIKALASPTLPATIALTMSSPSLIGPVVLDGGFLQDSVLNLIFNARDALRDTVPAAGGHIIVTADAKRDTWLEITVTDSGPGFQAEALKHGLDPFFTTKPGNEGSGLGLSMVYDFAQASGGYVKLANARTGGACVTLRLPLKYGPKPTTPKLILLVEDSPEIRVSIREMLQSLGHSVLEATSVDEAETLAGIPGIDVVLTDIRLNGSRSGLDLVHALQNTNNMARLLMMTSLPRHNDLHHAAANEFPLIAKPFKTAELSEFLELHQP